MLSVLSFADGHAEMHRWLDPRTTPPVTGAILAHWNDSPGNADLAWIRERTACPIDDPRWEVRQAIPLLLPALRPSLAATATNISAPPKAQTIAAPVGRSNL